MVGFEQFEGFFLYDFSFKTSLTTIRTVLWDAGTSCDNFLSEIVLSSKTRFFTFSTSSSV
jgi:hypothetical protein